MPARRIINLLPQDPFASSLVGKFLMFSITVGRYVVVLTELVVILAFLSRFFLDRTISDLNDRIKQQVGVIDASRDFETNFRLTQARLVAVGALMQNQYGVADFLRIITPLISPDITVTRLAVQDNGVVLSGVSASVDGLRQTITAFQKSSWLSDVSLTGISASDTSGNSLRFTLNATIRANGYKRGVAD